MGRAELIKAGAAIAVLVVAVWYFLGLDSRFESSRDKPAPEMFSDSLASDEAADASAGTSAGNASGVQRVVFDFPADIEADESEFPCEPRPAEGDGAGDFVISKARDLGECRQLHVRVMAPQPEAAVTNFLQAYRDDGKNSGTHAYEIDRLLQVYAYLLSPQEFAVLDDIEEQPGERGKIAKRILDFRREASDRR